MKYVALGGLTLAIGVFGFLWARARQSSVPAASGAPNAVVPTTARLSQPTVAVYVFDRDGKLVGPVRSPNVELSADEWRHRLSPEAFDVLRNQGTEPAGSGEFVDTTADGVYTCAGCGLPLFSSEAKFHSGTGWPSFYQPIEKENVAEMTDRSFGGERTEIHCPRCGGHLGHVFDDGPKPTGLRYCIDSVSLRFTPRDKLASLADPAADKPAVVPAAVKSTAANSSAKHSTQTAVFAAGCFWATEAAFDQIKGVVHVESGYSGGAKETAQYETVCRGNTGHAESVEVTFDPSIVSYDRLLDVFFTAHNPTQPDGQGNDLGPQYRSVIFCADDAQRRAAEAKIKQLTSDHAFAAPIVTSVEPLKTFFPAEDYHQNYVHLHPDDSYIRNVSMPKVEHVRAKYPELLKPGE